MAKALRFLRKSHRDIWVLRLVALMISILLWITILGGKRVELDKTVTLEYQLSESMIIANRHPQTVLFRISGPRAFLKDFEERSMSIPVDLSEAEVGEYDLRIREDMLDLPLGLKVHSVAPQQITVRLDQAIVRRVPVRASFVGQLPNSMKVKRVAIRPSTVDVRGAQSRLQALEAIPTEAVALNPNSLLQEFDISLNLSDLPGVHLLAETDSLVNLKAELEGSMSRRWLAGIPVKLMLPNAGGMLSPQQMRQRGFRIEPETVRFQLEGPDSLVRRLDHDKVELWVELSELPQSGQPMSVQLRIDWALAPEFRVISRSTDRVELRYLP